MNRGLFFERYGLFFLNEHCFFKDAFHLHEIYSGRLNESHRLYKIWVLKHFPTLINHTAIVPFENLMNIHTVAENP